ncbi:MAG: hypothetical protein RL026_2524, partial [Pseudomonadota bacterium]
AIMARWGRPLDQLDADHPGTRIIGGYLGQLAANLALTCSVDRVIFGGGVMDAPGLLAEVRTATRARLNGYLQDPCYGEAIDQLVVPPGLGHHSGITGAMLLAEQAYIEAQAAS